MLQQIRDRAQGIIVWTIVGLIIITFALFGLSSYLSGTSKSIVATVNGVEISQTQLLHEYQNTQQRLQQALGKNYDPSLFNEQAMKERVLEGLIQRELLNQELEKAKFHVAPQQVLETIKNIPAFQDKTGKFSPENYQRMLQLQGMNNAFFEQQLAHDIADEDLRNGLQHSALVTDLQIKRYQQLEGERRKIGYFILPLDTYLKKVSISDGEVQAYYEEHPSEFSTPELASVDYIELNLDDMATGIEVSNEEIKDYYDQHLENYVSEPERRKVRHILIQVDENTDDSAARAKAEKLAKQIKNGADFSELARKESDDSVSAKQGGELGYINRGMMDKTFDQAAFSLGKGELSNPVRSRFGYHLILVDDIQPAKVKSLAEATPQIRKEIQTQMAEQRFYEDVDKLNNLSYEIPDSLAPVAEQLGVTVKHSPLYGRTGGAGLFANPKVTSATFSDEVLQENRNSELIEISDTHVLVLRIREHKPATRRPLDEVKQGIISILKQDKARELALQDAEQAISQLKAGQDPAKVATSNRQQWQEVGFISRKPGVGDKLDNRLRTAAFRSQSPGSHQPVFTNVVMPGGNIAILAVDAVEPGKAEMTPDNITHVRNTLSTAAGQAIYQAFITYLESTADISRNLKPEEQ
jgi:peptidyl-prolyl cis-trans isomerase D